MCIQSTANTKASVGFRTRSSPIVANRYAGSTLCFDGYSAKSRRFSGRRRCPEKNLVFFHQAFFQKGESEVLEFSQVQQRGFRNVYKNPIVRNDRVVHSSP